MKLQLTILMVIAAGMNVAGCSRNEAAEAYPLPEVTVAEAKARTAAEFQEFTGHIEAIERVELRPRVSGYVARVRFSEGEEVRKGDILFEIDSRPYEAELKRAKAGLVRAIAARNVARSAHERAKVLVQARAISNEEFETLQASQEQAEAQIEAARAEVDIAEMNLTFSTVRSPIAGVVSKAAVTAGNLVTSGETILTTIVSTNPVYVVFDGDERRILRAISDTQGALRGKLAKLPISVGFADEADYPHEGQLVFVNNEINPQTGTIRLRGRLDNATGRFTPGMFARVRIASEEAHQVVLIDDRAVATDQNLRVAFVVDGKNKVEQRTIEIGALADGLRIVRSGLKPGDRVVTDGLQHIRPGVVVNPKSIPDEQKQAQVQPAG